MSNTENNSGWRAVLTHGVIYKLVQFVFSEKKSKALILDDFVIPAGQDCSLLDMGCGPGNLRKFLPDTIDYTGFDLSADYIELAKNKYRDSAAQSRFLCGSAAEFMDSDLISDNTIDVVVIHGVLHHVPDTVVEEMFSLARKKLKVGGRMVVLEPVWFENQSPLRRWVMQRDRGNNIKVDHQWVKLFTRLSEDWAEIDTKIEQNLIRFYDLIVLSLTKTGS